MASTFQFESETSSEVLNDGGFPAIMAQRLVTRNCKT